MTVDYQLREQFEAFQLARELNAKGDPRSHLQGGGGGDNFGGMEVRVAKLEASMDHALAELSKLSSVPADVATIKERLTHMPTKDEMRSAIEAAADRADVRLQRTFAIGGMIITTVITLASIAINYAFKVAG